MKARNSVVHGVSWSCVSSAFGSLLKLCSFFLLASLLIACSTKKRGIGTDDDVNIPYAEGTSNLKTVFFAYDSSGLDDTSKSLLQENAEWLRKHGEAKVVVEGHCDERGTIEYNLALGSNRARSVFDYLRGLGVSSDRMDTTSYGEELPLDPRQTEEAYARNRRVQFQVKD